VTLQWTPPDNTSAFAITGYVIKFGVVGSNTDDYDIEQVDNVITSHEFSGKLEPKTSYQFAVAAVNQAARQGPWSDFSECVHTKTGKYNVPGKSVTVTLLCLTIKKLPELYTVRVHCNLRRNIE